MPQSMGLQRVRHELATEQQQNMVQRKKTVKLYKASGKISCLQNCPKITLTFAQAFPLLGASLIAQLVKNLPAMQETLVQFLGREEPLEKGKATHSSILA